MWKICSFVLTYMMLRLSTIPTERILQLRHFDQEIVEFPSRLATKVTMSTMHGV
jgi:hypothetical protein